MAATTRIVDFGSEHDAIAAVGIAERCCEAIAEGSKVTLIGSTKEIGDALLEVQYNGLRATAIC